MELLLLLVLVVLFWGFAVRHWGWTVDASGSIFPQACKSCCLIAVVAVFAGAEASQLTVFEVAQQLYHFHLHCGCVLGVCLGACAQQHTCCCQQLPVVMGFVDGFW